MRRLLMLLLSFALVGAMFVALPIQHVAAATPGQPAAMAGYDYDTSASVTTTRLVAPAELAVQPVRAPWSDSGFVYDPPHDRYAPNATRLSQDVAVSPIAPRALPTSGRSVGRPSHNQALQTDLANLPPGARDIRVNQQQVNAAGQRVGINRPDLQYTVNGQRYYIEYEGVPPVRGADHTTRITANDPTAIVIVREVP